MAEAKDTSAGAAKSINLTESEGSFLLVVMQNLKSEIQFDADAIASQMGYKDGSIVKARWNTIKRTKLSGTNPSTSPTGIKKRSPKKTSLKKSSGGNGEAGESPTQRGRKKQVKAGPEEDVQVAEDDEVKAEEDGGIKLKAEEAEDVE